MATSARLDELKKKFDENPRRYFAPLANEYRKLGDLTQAVALCRAHLPNQPGHISGHIVLAQALYEARELGESRQIFEASLELDPENLIALRYLGDIAREQGEPGIARGWYERVLDADPRNDEIAQLLSQLDLEPAAAAPLDEPDPAVAIAAAGTESAHAETDAGFAEAPADDEPTFVTPTPVELDAATDDAGAHDPLSAPAVASHANPFPEPDELLHDLPSGAVTMSFFEDAGTEPPYGAADEAAHGDPFFGAAASAGTLASGELEAVSDAHVDDWFSSAAPPAGSEPAPAVAAAEGFEDSFFPDLSHVTPVASAAVESATALDPAGLGNAALHASDLSTIPTPPFLAAIDEPAAPVADVGGTDQGAEALDAVADGTYPIADEHVLDAESAPVGRDDAVSVASDTGGSADVTSPATPWSTDALTPSWDDEVEARAEIVDADFSFASGVPVGETSEGRDDDEVPTLEVEVIPDAVGAAPVPVSTLDAVPASFDAFLGTDDFVATESPDAGRGDSGEVMGAFDGADHLDGSAGQKRFADIDASLAPAHATSPDLSPEYDRAHEVEAAADADERGAFDAFPEAPALAGVQAIDESDSSVQDVAPSVAALATVDDALPGAAFESQQDVADAAPAGDAVLAAGDDFVVEYAEFVPPDHDSTPFIASSISVPLEADEPVVSADAYSVGAPELSAHEPFPTESAAETLEDSAPAVVGAVSDATLVEVTPVEGLLSREVPAVEDFMHVEEVGESVEVGAPAFVTETMAELYLQQGFQDEALAIYRQLLAQSPEDQALRDRVQAIERGAASTVVEGIAPRDSVDRAGQSVRQFFAHFARRVPRLRADAPAALPVAVEGTRWPGEGEGRTAGAANRDEALTVPDEPPSADSLTTLFSSGVVSGADEDAATHLASAFGGGDFGGGEAAPASRSAERELSLEHLFRDVPSHSSGAVTLDEYYQGSSPGGIDPASPQGEAGEEHGADIEQFTAWLEGLKKK